MTSTGEAVGPADQALDPIRTVRGTLRALATVVAPTSVVTSLLYYFGWTRALYQSRAMGFDSSLLGFSTQDYLLQSLAPMFWPLLVGLLTAIAGLLGHVAVVVYAGGDGDRAERGDRRRRRRLLRRLAYALTGLGVVLAGLGVAGATVESPSRLVSIAYPLCLSASIVFVAYATYLRLRFRPKAAAGRPTPELRAAQFAVSSLVVLLLLLSLFWSVTNYAGNKGHDLALLIDRELATYPDTTIYSAKRLYLRPPVVETALDGGDAAYMFEYTGLKLLFRTRDRYFLRPSHSTPTPTNIVIPDTHDVRFEFTRSGRP